MSKISKVLMGRWLRPGGRAARKFRTPRLGLEAMEGRTLLSGADPTAIIGPPAVEVHAQAAARLAMWISEVDAYAIQGRVATFTARLTNADTGAAVSSRAVSFRLGDTLIGTARTDSSGLATLSNVRVNLKAGVYSRRVVASFAGTPRLGPASARGPITVSRAVSSMASVAASGSFGGGGTFVARVVSGKTPVVGRNVQFLIGSQVVATARTDSQGFAVVAGINLGGRTAGTYAIRARFAGDAGFARSASAGTLTVSRAMVDVSISSPSVTYNGQAHVASATASQPGVPITISYTDSAGNSVALPVKAGSYRVTASVDDPNYFGQTTGTLTIAQASLTATGLTANKVYNGTTAATIDASGAVLSGVVAGDTVAINTAGVVANFATKNVGTDLPVIFSGLGLSGADAANYSLVNPVVTGNITQASLVVTGITANNKVYDGTTAATIDSFGAALSGAVPTDDVHINASAAVGTFDSKSAGINKMVFISGLELTGTDASNYFLSPTILGATISPAAVTVSGVTASDKVYDATTSATVDASAATISGVLAGDTVGFNGSAATGEFASKNVGNGVVVSVYGLQLTGTDALNYAIGTTTATANVTPAPLSVVSGVNADKVYDGTTVATLHTSGAVFNGLFAGDSVTLDTAGVTASFATRNVGANLPVTYSGLALAGTDGGNYVLTGEPEVFGTITPAALTIAGLTAHDRAYDGTTDATLLESSPSLVGVVAGDDVTLNATGASVAFADKNAGTNKTVLISGVSVSGSDVGNYTLDTTSHATITPRALTVLGATAENKVYDASTQATVVLTGSTLDESGILAGDTVAYDPANTSGVVATFDDKNVGVGKTVTITGLFLTGADAGNYAASAVATADITRASLSVSGVNANKVYDGTTDATLHTSGAVFNGLFTGDSVTLDTAGVTASFATRNVGNGLAVTYSGLVLSGADSGNYDLVDPVVTGDVTPATLHLNGAVAVSRNYDGTTGATVNLSGASLSGVIGGEDVSFLANDPVGSFADKNAGTNKTVTITGVTLTGSDMGNYVLAPITTTADIHKATLNVTGITADNKVYDGTTTATIHTSGASLSGVVAGDAVALDSLAAMGQFDTPDVGVDKTVTITGLVLTGTDADNYELNPVTTTADITAA